ncbi:MAG: molybdate ABC transporter substrate-binding protein [Nitrospinae bacterium]|nr:molybdate ABC transporter substrate-binding protein [Nitrospinota bacterium]
MVRLLSVLLLTTATAMSARAETLRVAVASPFAPTLRQVAPLFEAATGHHPLVDAASTGTLVARIAKGVPFDLLLADDAARPFELERRGFAAPGGRFTYALGRLALVSRRRDAPPGPSALTDDREGKIALPDPGAAPYGEAGREVLVRLGVGDPARLVVTKNVATAFRLVATGEARYGLVAAALVPQGEKEGIGLLWDIPDTMHPPIIQQGVVLKGGKQEALARRFVDFLLHDPAAMKLIAGGGYHLPPAR